MYITRISIHVVVGSATFVCSSAVFSFLQKAAYSTYLLLFKTKAAEPALLPLFLEAVVRKSMTQRASGKV
jgi:hypothetical protein